MRKTDQTPAAVYRRIASKSYIDDDTGCWIFTGAKSTGGYGRIGGPNYTTRQVHRVAYEIFVGPIPDGLELDHLCRNRACWNPDHLEPVTHRINDLRGRSPRVLAYLNGVCLQGHPVTPDSQYRSGNRRQCAICARANARRRYRERQASA